MNLTIRKAIKSDMPEVLNLIKELALFEKEPDAVELTSEELIEDGFKDNPEFFCIVAEMDNSIIGMALGYKRYSTWKGQVLHLEDLIVKRESRGMQIGTKLLDEVVKYGHDIEVKRISWEVLDWNQPAIELYNKKGAKIKEDWRVVHLDEQAINKYISRLKNESI